MAEVNSPVQSQVRMTKQHRLTLTLLLGAQFMFAVDFSILTVALPIMGRDLGFTLENLQWIATAFALTAAGFMLLFGRLADIAGRRKFFLGGMALLTVASLVGGLASSPEVLIIARVAQGLATAMVTPAALSLLTTSFPEGPMRNKALGLNGALLSLGFAAGAVLGGVLTDLFSWRWTFYINVPVGLVILIAASFVVVDNSARKKTALDVPGAVTVTGGLLALVYGITGVERSGWASASTLGSLVLALILLVAFIQIELRAPHPLAPLRVLTRSTVKWGNLGGLVTFSMESALAYLMTLYMQEVIGLSAFQTGLAFGVLGAGAFLGGTFASRVIGRIGARNTLILGLVIQAVMTGMLGLLGTNATTGIIMVLIGTSVGGFGHVLAIVAYTVTATSGLPDEEQGLATGLTSVTQQIAFTMGIPILATVATLRINSFGDPGAIDSILGGITFATLIDAAVVLAAALLIGLFLGKKLANGEATPTSQTDAPVIAD